MSIDPSPSPSTSTMAFPTPAEFSNTTLPLPDPEAYEGEPREYARALMQRKDELEREIETMRGVLASHNSDASTSLIDPEGYPRGDIDIYAIRHARAALARLNTDIRTVNDRLPRALEAVFTTPLSAPTDPLPTSSGTGISASTSTANPTLSPSTSASTSTSTSTAIPTPNPTQGQGQGPGITRSQSGSRSPNPTQRLTPPSMNGDRLPDIRAPSTAPPRRRGPRMSDEARDQENWPSRPVARVNSVEPGSPAHESGLKAGDVIYMFERVTHVEGLREIGHVVRSGTSPLTLLVERGETRLALSLRPRVGWGGSGSLGCHIVPI